MIRRFEPVQFLEPEHAGQFQWGPALGAGLIAGIVLLLIPHGSPWSGVSFFSSVIMGRAVPAGVVMPLPAVCIVHLVLAEIYGLIISSFLTRLTYGKAVLTGALLALVLYVVNFAVVSLALPAWRTNEIGVMVTHVVFGLIVGGAYRGLLRRKPTSVSSP